MPPTQQLMHNFNVNLSQGVEEVFSVSIPEYIKHNKQPYAGAVLLLITPTHG